MNEALFSGPWWIYATLVVLGSVGIHVFSKLSGGLTDPLLLIFIAHVAATILIAGLYVYTRSATGEIFSALNVKPLLYAGFMGISIALANCGVLYMYKQGAPISIAVPLTRTAVATIAVIIGIAYFSESLSTVKLSGFILSLISIYMMTRP